MARKNRNNKWLGKALLSLLTLGVLCVAAHAETKPGSSVASDPATASEATSRTADPVPWKIGEPIVTYWAGPGYNGGGDLTDKAAAQLAEGGWNLVWCQNEKELDVAHRHGLRGLLSAQYPTLANVLDNPETRKALDDFLARIKNHPALYAYYVVDEPSAQRFPELGHLADYLREKDPEHPPYINLFPTYASNEQLGIEGDTVTAYKEYLKQYFDFLDPVLLSYDHYQFTRTKDEPGYFLNLALIREKALEAGVPFLNLVQAASWGPTSAASPDSPREPNEKEMRFLVYTTLAYGAQGIGYYVYCFPGHTGGIMNPNGTPTALYKPLKDLNREFVAIAKELQPLRSLGAFHAGMQPPGVEPLTEASAFTLDPPVATMDYTTGERVQGILIGVFGNPESGRETHALIVNLDYKKSRTVGVKGRAPLEVFDATRRTWTPINTNTTKLSLKGGSGKLLRFRPEGN